MEEGKSFVLYIRILRIIRKKKLCNYEIVFFFRWRGPFRTFLLEKLKFRSIIYAQTKRVLFELHEFLCGEVWCVMAVVISCFGNLVVIFVEIPFEWYCQVIDDYNRLE